MTNKWLYLLIFGVVLFVAFYAFSRPWAENQWLLYPRLPTPPEARNVQIGHFINSSDAPRRETHFDIAPPADIETVRAFYRAELPRQGLAYDKWTTSCGDALWPSDRFSDTYSTNNWSVYISQSEITQQIEVIESQNGRLVVEPPQTGLEGDWRALNQDDDAPFMFCFSGPGILAYAENEGTIGPYKQTGSEISINFVSTQLIRPSEVPSDPQTLCNRLPAFFQSSCQVEIIDPASYPSPNTTTIPTSQSEAQSSQGPYPAPASLPDYPVPGYTNEPLWTEVMRIDGAFTITLDQDTLTLTSETGDTQVFERVLP